MTLAEDLGQALIWFFTETPLVGDAMAAVIAFSLIGLSWLIILYNWLKHHRPLRNAIAHRNDVLKDVLGSSDAPQEAARQAFAERYDDIDSAMMDVSSPEADQLHRTWEEYRDTFVGGSDEIVQNTVRPEIFFGHLGERHRALSWWANIFIALGLLITFLGIIAALSTLDFSGSADAMQAKLNDLMKVAGAKFWASVGGIVGSIFLRIADYRFHKSVNEGLAQMCDRLEHGMAYLPPQRIAAQQLHELKEQTPTLKAFSDQLAAAIDGALETRMAPMITHLGSIQSGIEKISGGGGEAVREALTSSAGAEMAGLADAIGAMSASMAGMAERMEKQTGEADRQIEKAVDRFGQASDEMRQAFGELNSNFEAVAERMRQDTEEAGAMARQQMTDLLGNLGSTLDEMKGGLAAAAAEMGSASSAAAQDAARIGQEALETSFSRFAERFAETGAPLVGSMRDASDAMASSAQQMNSARTAIGDHARSIELVAEKSDELAGAFGTVANDVEAATTPVRQSATSIAEAVKSIEGIIANSATSSENTREEMRSLAAALNDTAEAATTAWSDYRARFADVDKSLGTAIGAITNATSDHATNLNERVGQIDSALGDAVSKLQAALSPLTDLNDVVQELAGIMSKQAAAE